MMSEPDMHHPTTLFCLPHAGASSSSYLMWKRLLPHHVVVRPVELAGRGKRIYEPLYGSIAEAVNDLYAQISEELEIAPYAFFGHSMGTLLAYELVRTIKHHQRREPVHVFFSGRVPPFVPNDCEWTHTLPDAEFIQRVCDMGGTNPAVFEDKDLLEVILPVLRADYGIIERYCHQGEIVMFDCQMAILHGRHDAYAEKTMMQRWQECARKGYTFHEFDGDHFFIQPFKAEITELIQRTLVTLS